MTDPHRKSGSSITKSTTISIGLGIVLLFCAFSVGQITKGLASDIASNQKISDERNADDKEWKRDYTRLMMELAELSKTNQKRLEFLEKIVLDNKDK